MNIKKTAALPAMAALGLAALVGTALPASAQSARDDGSMQHRARVIRHRAGERPLTVRRHAPLAPVVAEAPRYNPYAGPGAIVTGPVGVASTAVALPFRVLGGIFPPNGTPLMVVGAPIQFAGRLAQLPFDIAEAPFGGPGPFSGPGPFDGPEPTF